jgi:hypothetical protein
MRIGTWNIVMFVTLEQIKKAIFPPLKKEWFYFTFLVLFLSK